MMENGNRGDKMATAAFGGDGGGGAQWNPLLPSIMPWSSGTPLPMTQVVHFTAADHHYGYLSNETSCATRPLKSMLIPKRKCPIDLEAPPPKIHVTDEQMACRMKGLHIGGNNESFNLMTQQNFRLPQQQRHNDEVSTAALPTLVVCDEIRQLRMPDNILPHELLARLERPSKALVVWKPPEQRVTELMAKSVQQEKEEEKKEESMLCSSSSSLQHQMDPFNNNSKLFETSVQDNDVEDMALDVDL